MISSNCRPCSRGCIGSLPRQLHLAITPVPDSTTRHSSTPLQPIILRLAQVTMQTLLAPDNAQTPQAMHSPPVLDTVWMMSERSSLHSCRSWARLKFFMCTG